MTLHPYMEPSVLQALQDGGIADITTTGRRTGQPRRIEIFFHNFEGGLFIGGRPGFKRDWLANLKAHPRFTLHLKRGVRADLAATAAEVADPKRRADLFYRMLTESWGVEPDRAQRGLSRYVEDSPLVQVTVEKPAGA
jgi:deazaflavin-dependent oxidoreductase (nitroreductase family)